MDVDVAIVGGGAAGAAAAIALRRAKCSVVLVSPASTTPDNVCGETLSPSAIHPLTRLGIWKRFISDRHPRCVSNFSAWGSSEIQTRESIFNADGLGWIINRKQLDTMLTEAAAECGAIQCHEWLFETPNRLTNGGWRLNCSRGTSITARYLVDASGRSARIARRLRLVEKDAEQLVAIYGVFPRKRNQRICNWSTAVESAPLGWWYTVPDFGGGMIAILFTDASLIRQERLLEPNVWAKHLRATTLTNERCQHFSAFPGSLQTKPAGAHCTTPVAQRDWLAVGDAAMTFDPLSGLGISSALTSGVLGAEAIEAAMNDQSQSLAHYGKRILAVHNEHLKQRSEFYRLELRWAKNDFWARRLGIGREALSRSA